MSQATKKTTKKTPAKKAEATVTEATAPPVEAKPAKKERKQKEIVDVTEPVETLDSGSVSAPEAETIRTKKGNVTFRFKEFEDELEKLKVSAEKKRDDAKDDLVTIKKLSKDFKKLQNELKSAKMRKRASKGDATRVPSGFASEKGVYLSPELCEFLGEPHGTKLPRTVVASRLRDYIKGNGLEDTKDRRKIIADDKLERLFGNSEFRLETMKNHKNLKKDKLKGPVTDQLHYFNIQIHLIRHFDEPLENHNHNNATASA